MKMLYLKTKPTPSGRWRPSRTLCLLAALLLVDGGARALPPPLMAQMRLQRNISDSGVGGVDGVGVDGSGPQQQTTTAASAAADISVERTRFGVVVDWQSVCKHLCSSSLGGSGCGSHCVGSYTATGSHWISNRFLVGCPLLCSIRLGDTRCQCAPILTDDIVEVDDSDRDAVCALGCQTGNELSGCSECSESGPEQIAESVVGHSVVKADGIEVAAGDGESATTLVGDVWLSDSTDGWTSSMADSTETPWVTTNTVEETTMPTETTTTTTSTTTTTTTKKPTTTTTTAKPPTTPDWTEVCQNLCRIGEGGALCNCDLPPFF